MTAVLVTGGCGFIGTTLVPMLHSRGLEVKVLDNLVNASDAARRRLPSPWGADVEMIEGDIRDETAIARAMRDTDTVIHLAAYGSVVESVTDPLANFDVNVRGTLSVLQACVAHDVGQLVFASTGGALIGNVDPPVSEESVPRPIAPYGASKLCGEAYLHAFAGSYGLRTTALRFANVYGPHSMHKKGAVTSFILRAMASEPLVIYGDGGASRDFLYVDDLCEGIVAAAQSNLVDEVVHLASGVETPIRLLAETILEMTGRPTTLIEHQAPRPGEVYRNFAMSDRAQTLFRFSPQNDLREGLQRTVDWFRSYIS